MDTGTLVTVSCSSPREKLWGLLLALSAAGATVRAIRLEAFEEWLRQQGGGACGVAPATVFLPAHRIERIEADESSDAVEGLGDRFRRVVRRDPGAALTAGRTPAQPRGSARRRK